MPKSNKRTLKVFDGGRSKEKGSWITEEYKLPFSKGGPKIYKTRNSGENWSFSMWVSEENKYYTQALRTQIKTEALEKAEDLYIELRNNIKEGRKATKISLPKLIDQYLIYQQNRVTKSLIKPDRLSTITSRMRALQKYLPKNKAVSSLKKNDFLEYTGYRLAQGVQIYTIVQERSEIKALFNWALRNDFINPHQLPVFEELRKVKAPRRTDFLMEEYKECFIALRRLVNEEKNQKRKKEWEIFRDFFLISGNSGMRFGELRRIRWRDIRRMYKIKGEDQHPDGVVELYLPSNITKTGNDRTVVATAVPYFKRLKSLYDNPPPDQLIFANPRNLEEPCPPQFYYRHWDKMLEEAGLSDRQPKLTIYSLRHFYATVKMLKGVSIYDLSLTMGCSVSHIEKTYSHVKTSQVANRITRFRTDDDDLRTAIPI